MSDYYDRLETQLAELTERGAHRKRRFPTALPGRPARAEVLALAASVLVAATLAAMFLSVGNVRHTHQGSGTHRPNQRILRNIYPAALPAPPGALICESPIAGPRNHSGARGEVRFYAAPPASTGMLMSATGLKRLNGGSTYVVWLLPAVQTLSGGYQLQGSATPELLGVIEPAAAASGHLTVSSVLAAHFSGVYKLLITAQPRSATQAPGRVVLSGFVNF